MLRGTSGRHASSVGGGDNDAELAEPLSSPGLSDSSALGGLLIGDADSSSGEEGICGGSGGGKGSFVPVLYAQRWVQLGILSCLALVSDLVCFSVAAVPSAFTEVFPGHSPTTLVDIFLFTNVAGCFLVTDLTRIFGLRKVIVAASVLMSAGCLLKSGLPLFGGGLPPHAFEVAGTVLVGAAQPFFQCTPPLLSATWFGPKERALATAVAINFNQVGIGSAFLLGGFMVHGDAPPGPGLHAYFGLITLASAALAAVTFLKFEERPPTPPSRSAAAAHKTGDGGVAEGLAAQVEMGFSDSGAAGVTGGNLGALFTFPGNAASLFRKPGFLAPLAAFVTSIGVTNVVSAFTETTLHRAGLRDQTTVDLCGAGFQLAIVLGGIVVGGYVDRTKEFKEVTLACLSATLGLLILLGLAFGFDLNMPHVVVIAALLGLGATAGPVQPINAELAVEVSYPADETSIEAVQQLCGNLFSALLVPLCEVMAARDFDVLPGVGPAEDMRGDSLVLVVLVGTATLFFTTFDAPLKRSEFDNLAESD